MKTIFRTYQFELQPTQVQIKSCIFALSVQDIKTS